MNTLYDQSKRVPAVGQNLIYGYFGLLLDAEADPSKNEILNSDVQFAPVTIGACGGATGKKDD